MVAGLGLLSIFEPKAEAADWSGRLYEDATAVIETMMKQEIGDSLGRFLARRSPALCYYMRTPIDHLQTGEWGGMASAVQEALSESIGDLIYYLLTPGKTSVSDFWRDRSRAIAKELPLCEKETSRCCSLSWWGEKVGARSLVTEECETPRPSRPSTCAITQTLIDIMRSSTPEPSRLNQLAQAIVGAHLTAALMKKKFVTGGRFLDAVSDWLRQPQNLKVVTRKLDAISATLRAAACPNSKDRRDNVWAKVVTTLTGPLSTDLRELKAAAKLDCSDPFGSVSASFELRDTSPQSSQKIYSASYPSWLLKQGAGMISSSLSYRIMQAAAGYGASDCTGNNNNVLCAAAAKWCQKKAYDSKQCEVQMLRQKPADLFTDSLASIGLYLVVKHNSKPIANLAVKFDDPETSLASWVTAASVVTKARPVGSQEEAESAAEKASAELRDLLRELGISGDDLYGDFGETAKRIGNLEGVLELSVSHLNSLTESSWLQAGKTPALSRVVQLMGALCGGKPAVDRGPCDEIELIKSAFSKPLVAAIVGAVQRRSYRTAAAIALRELDLAAPETKDRAAPSSTTNPAAPPEDSHLRTIWTEFLRAVVAYVVEARTGEDSDVARGAFRATAGRLLRLAFGTGYPEGGWTTYNWPRSTSGWRRFYYCFGPTFGLRVSWNPTYGNRVSSDYIRYVASVDLLPFQWAITDYVGIHISWLDALAPVIEYVQRKPGVYSSGEYLGLEFIKPRLEMWLGVPQLTRRVALSVGVGLRWINPVECQFADPGACTGEQTMIYKFKVTPEFGVGLRFTL